MTKKKSSFGRIIFILILLLILIGGGYFGYKYYSEGKTPTTNVDGKDFQIAGTWYVENIDEGINETAFNFIEYTFETPANVEGKWTGQINAVSNDAGNPKRTGSYKIVGKNKLIISFPHEMDYEFTYTHYPDEQKLEMDFVGQKRTLIREKPVVQESAPQTEEEIKAEEEKVQTQLWMDKIADVDWKASAGKHIIRFNKPTQEGDTIRGKYNENVHGSTYNYKYIRLADGEIQLENNIKFKMQLNEKADTLYINNGYADYTFSRN